MFRKSLFKLFTVIVVFALTFAQVGSAKAARMDLGGEEEDNFWELDTLYCKDGFSITATHTQLGVPTTRQANNGDLIEPFWLELGSSTIPIVPQTVVDIREPAIPPAPVQAPALARIAHGDGSGYINGGQPFTVNFLFTQLQSVGTGITITVERWDHGAMTWVEPDIDGDADVHDADDDGDSVDDNTDESTFDDLVSQTQSVEDCLIDSVAPTITITSPLAQDYLQTATVSTTWNVTDDFSGVASSSGMLDAASVTNGQAVNLFSFLPGPHTLTVNAADNSGNTAQASVTFNVVVTIDSLITATQSACSMGWISKKGICQSLLAKLAAAKAANGRGQNQAMRGVLKAFLNELNAQKGKSVNQSAYDLLTADAQALLH